MIDRRFHALNFAIAGAIYLALMGFAVTVAAILKIPGLPEFARALEQFYGPWGYSISAMGAFVGAFWGLVEGFIHFGVFALIYNALVGRVTSVQP